MSILLNHSMQQLLLLLLLLATIINIICIEASNNNSKNKKIRLKVQATNDVQLMIPFPISKSIQDLIDQINKRCKKHRLIKNKIKDPKLNFIAELYVNDALLFEDDLIGDVLNENDLIISKWNDGSYIEVESDGEQHVETAAPSSPPPPKDEEYKINMGRGLIMDVTLKPNGYISDLADSIMNAVEGQLASARTSIVELQLDGATLFPDDVANKLIDPNSGEVINVIWGFKYTIQATDTITYPIALYHNAKIRNLIYAARNLGLQHNKLKDRDDMIVDLRKSNGMNLLEYHDQLVTGKLSESDNVLHAVWGKIYFINSNIYDNISGGGGDDPKRPSETVGNDNDIEPLVVGVSSIGYVSTMIQNANIAVSQNSDVYHFARKNTIVNIQLGDGSILDKNALVTDVVSKGDELYAIWKDISEYEDDEE